MLWFFVILVITMDKARQNNTEATKLTDNRSKLFNIFTTKSLVILFVSLLVIVIGLAVFYEINKKQVLTQSAYNGDMQTISDQVSRQKYTQALNGISNMLGKKTTVTQRYAIYVEEASIYVIQNKKDQALQAFNNAYNLQPQSADAYILLNMATIYKDQGNKPAAIKFFKAGVAYLNSHPNDIYAGYIPQFQADIKELGGS